MIPKPPAHVLTIDDATTLATFVSDMAQRDWIAIDTEFLRERTYHPQLCLVQIADTERAGVIDVLAIDDLTPLGTLLTDTTVTKVFHSAEQDLEVLLHTFGTMPGPVFDTQLAGPLAGLDDQMGYARMVDALLDVKLSKAHTRTDWRQRPLPEGAMAYAADDVRYLSVAYRLIVDELARRDRLAWAMEDAERLTVPDRFAPEIDGAWRRIKAWPRLSPAAQQILAELASWREHEALTADRPRRWILADDAIIALAETAPTDDLTLADTPALPEKTLARHGEALLAAVARGLARNPVVLDPDAGPPDAATKRQIKAGMQALEDAARQSDVPAPTLSSRAEIARLVAGRRDLRLLQGWRRTIAGETVQRAVAAAQQN
ncbi:ribonuclease D [Salinisphaera sp. Q1T1-3]|uniref:ribonuclease D n=1 Tax=Salinisphaera sp. Q1T1-3 TaxID=2321229 RepID=UPI001314DD66|nr:ribonuclease D [Salinisphaera sp. Q1T1-3]